MSRRGAGWSPETMNSWSVEMWMLQNHIKFTRFGAWIISTWGFVYIIVNSPTQFPEWYFVGYMTVWVGNAIMGKYVGTMSPQVPQQPQKEL